MSNAGPGLSPNKQAQTSKVAPTNVAGDKVTAGYQAGTRSPGTNRMFKTDAPKAPAISPGTGGSKGTGGRGREPQCLVSGKLYTPPKNG